MARALCLRGKEKRTKRVKENLRLFIKLRIKINLEALSRIHRIYSEYNYTKYGAMGSESSENGEEF